LRAVKQQKWQTGQDHRQKYICAFIAGVDIYEKLSQGRFPSGLGDRFHFQWFGFAQNKYRAKESPTAALLDILLETQVSDPPLFSPVKRNGSLFFWHIYEEEK